MLKSMYKEREDQIIKVFRTLSFIYNLMVGLSVIVLFIVDGKMGKDNVVFQGIGLFWGLTVLWCFSGFLCIGVLVACDTGGFYSWRNELILLFLPPGILAAILLLAGYNPMSE
jgi:hypothetical protein